MVFYNGAMQYKIVNLLTKQGPSGTRMHNRISKTHTKGSVRRPMDSTVN